MVDNPGHYRTRAETERANAATATLDNVRDRCIRSALAWEELAERYEKMRLEQAKRELAVSHAA